LRILRILSLTATLYSAQVLAVVGLPDRLVPGKRGLRTAMDVQNTAARIEPARSQLDYLPIGLFGSVMGLTGLSVAWRLALAGSKVPGWTAAIAPAIGALAIVAFLALVAGYAIKALTAFEAVRNEFRHPIAGNLFGTAIISLLLLPILLAPYGLALARVVWAIGAIGMILFAWFIVSRWMSDRQQVAHATPAWIVPVVGLLDVPLALPTLGLQAMDGVEVFSLAVGLFFAVPLFTLIFSRLLFEAPLPDPLKPTLLILVAPSAVGYSAYSIAAGSPAGSADLFAQSLYLLTLFLLAVLLGQLRNLPLCCPFRVSWWAVSFPLAASAAAAARYAAARPGIVTLLISWTLLALATLIIAGLLARTLLGLARGELRTLST
jgi:tellurite resistance protein